MLGRSVVLAVPFDTTILGDSRRVQCLQTAAVPVALSPELYVEGSACVPDVSKRFGTKLLGE